MEQTQATAVQSSTPETTSSSPAAASTPESVVSAAITSKANGAAPEAVSAEGTQEVPAYNPNFKFKVLDQEKEFDEWLRPVIKDAETEKKARELFERAHGIDFVKEQRDRYRKQFQELDGEFTPIKKDIQAVGNYIKNQDVFGLIQFLGLPKEAVFKAVKTELDYMELPPEQRSVVDQRRAAAERAYAMEQQNMTLQQQVEAARLENLEFQVQTTLSSPEMRSYASEFDSREGNKPGSFRNAVLRMGAAMHTETGKLPTPLEAAQEFVRLAGLKGSAATSAATQDMAKPAVQETPVVISKPEKPVITNVKSRPASPVKAKPKSLDDLRKLQKQMAGV